MEFSSEITSSIIVYFCVFTALYFSFTCLYNKRGKYGYLGLVLITMIVNMGSYAYFLHWIIESNNALSLGRIYFDFFMNRDYVFFTRSELSMLVCPVFLGIAYGGGIFCKKNNTNYSM